MIKINHEGTFRSSALLEVKETDILRLNQKRSVNSQFSQRTTIADFSPQYNCCSIEQNQSDKRSFNKKQKIGLLSYC